MEDEMANGFDCKIDILQQALCQIYKRFSKNVYQKISIAITDCS